MAESSTPRTNESMGGADLRFYGLQYQPKLQDCVHGASATHGVPVYLPDYTAWQRRNLGFSAERSRQYNGRQLNPGPADLESNASTTTPLNPHVA